MTSQGGDSDSEDGGNTAPGLKRKAFDCWTRFTVWKNWFCDPEGPSPISFARDAAFRWILGALVFSLGLVTLLWTIPGASHFFALPLNCAPSSSSLCIDFLRYIGFGLILIGATFYVIGSHPKKLESKTAVYNEEIDNLVREVRTNTTPSHADLLKVNIDKEITDLLFLKEMPTEVTFLRLIALRKLRIELCEQYEELKALAESDIGDYALYVGDDDGKFMRYRNDFNALYRVHDRIFNTSHADREEPLLVVELKTHIKELREELQWEKHSSGQGEAIVKSFTYWSLVAILSLFMLGVTPLLHPPMLESELTILHWAFLGMAGAIIYTAISIRSKETSDLGFEEGNTELRKMLLGIVIGGITAVLLYATIRSGVFGGKILPSFESYDDPSSSSSEKAITNLLAVFWGTVAGYSAKLSSQLLGSSEKTLSA